MGLGSSIATAVSERTAVVIEDYMFDASVAGELTPEVSPSDFHDTWDLDGTDFTPEASPDDEGYWDDFSDIVTNGGFDADSDWTKTGGTSISGGKATVTGASGTSLLYQSLIIEGTTYELVYTVSDYSLSSGATAVINNDGTTIQAISGNGTFTAIFTHVIASGNLIFRATNGTNSYKLDNVSVTEYAITPLDV